MQQPESEMKILSSYNIGPLSLKNRIVMAPMMMNYGTKDGYVSDQTIAYYEQRAKAEVGLIVVEAASVDFSRSKCWIRQLSIDSDKYIPKMKELVESIHKHGSKAILQLHHGGSYARTDLTPLTPLSSSNVAYQDAYLKGSARDNLPEELTISGISEVVTKFGKAAKRAKDAGFDGIEINGAHGYLFTQFMSAARNKRTDDYGGNIENRSRILSETIHKIRNVVGANYPIFCRISAEETGIDGGITFEETKELVVILQKTTLDALGISGVPPIRTNYAPSGYFVKYLEEIRKLVRIPLIIAGAVDVQIGEDILKEDKADLIAMGRAFLADPEFPRKLAEGRNDEIRPCLRCCMCRDAIAFEDAEVQCCVNPLTGREKEIVVKPAENKKRVVIIGGGPSGMETGIIARKMGHDVTIYEKDTMLGGQLNVADMLPNKSEIYKFKNYLISQVKSLGINIKLGQEIDSVNFTKLGYDEVILATGSTPKCLDDSVCTLGKIMMLEDILYGEDDTGENVVVIGLGMTGCEIAHYFAKNEKKVTILEIASEADFKPSTLRAALLGILEQHNITIVTEAKIKNITPDNVLIEDKDGNDQTIKADTVVSSIGRLSDMDLYNEIKSEIPNKIYTVGDAVRPGRIYEAIQTAFHTALEL